MKTSLVGRWRIVEMEQWDQDYVDMDSVGHITFTKKRNQKWPIP